MKLLKKIIFANSLYFQSFSTVFEISYPDGNKENKTITTYNTYENTEHILEMLNLDSSEYTTLIDGKKFFKFKFENNKTYKIDLKKNKTYSFHLIIPNTDELKNGDTLNIKGYNLTIDEALIKILANLDKQEILKKYNLKIDKSILYPSHKYLKFFGGKFLKI